MNKKLNWMKSSLMGSSTMPLGALGGNPFPAAHGHTHSADGGCCGHHHHDHENTGDDCGHDHAHGEHCNHGE